MKARYFISLVFVLVSLVSKAQRYGNEWIRYDQTYYKLSVREEGIYRLTYSDLLKQGVPVSSIDPRNIQLFRRGKEQTIVVSGQEDGTFNTTDYIDFYGVKNDQGEEGGLYREGIQPMNPYTSMYSDTAAYFLTWSLSNEQGKRIQEVDHETYDTKLQIHTNVIINSMTEAYTYGRVPFPDIFRSFIDEGEGWVSFGVVIGRRKDFTFELPNAIEGTGIAEVMLVGVNSHEHNAQLVINGEDPVTVDGFSERQFKKARIPFTLTNGDNFISTSLTVYGKNDRPDVVSYVYVRFEYNQATEFSGNQKKFYFFEKDYQKQVSFTNTTGVSFYECINDSTIEKVNLINDGFGIESSADTVQKYLAVRIPNEVSKIEKITFKERDVNTNYLLLTHTDFTDELADYVAYRESPAGGGYNVQLKEIEEVFNEYGYGEYNPLAIRKYCDHMINNAKAEYLFIVGKGVELNHRQTRNDEVFYYRYTAHDTIINGSPLFSLQDYIPTFGAPGSDILFTKGLNGNDSTFSLATGRLTVSEASEIAPYLAKVKEHENLGFTELWRKNALHLSGGNGLTEPAQLLGYVNQYKGISEDTLWGAQVQTLTKRTTEEVEFYNISAPVNEGISLLTFFGHSAVRAIGVDFGNASDPLNGYNNKGKYPLLLINGCHAGEVFTSKAYTRAEDWLFTPEKGSVNAMAHISFGYASLLHLYSLSFYETAFQNPEYFGKSLGKIQQETARKFYSYAGFNEISHSQVNQFILLGDPAIALFPAERVEYEIQDAGLSIEPFEGEQITALTDSVKLSIPISNFGLAKGDSFSVCITRKYNNGQTTVTYDAKYPFVAYQDTLTFVVPSVGIESAGLNTFEVFVDCDQKILEYDEFNNFAKTEVFFPINSVYPLLPKEFTLLGKQQVKLVAQSYDLFIDENTEYILQLDTNASFSVPLMELDKVAGAYPSWELDLPITQDSTVYYWRVRLKQTELEEELAWQTSSFTYIQGKNGWAQADFDQFFKNGKEDIYLNKNTRTWNFDTTSVQLNFSSAGNGLADYQTKSFVIVDGKPVIRRGGDDRCVGTGVFVLTFDRETALPYNPYGLSYSASCGVEPRLGLSFVLNNSSNRDRLIQYLDIVPEGDYVLLVVSGDGQYTAWTPDLMDRMKETGATEIDNLLSKPGHPYVLLFESGTQKVLFEQVGTSTTDVLDIDYNLIGEKEKGSITSTTIGPATQWYNYYHTIEGANTDELLVDIFGKNLEGQEDLLYTYDLGRERDSLGLDTLGFSAENYPFLVLKARVSDTTTKTVPQLDNWIITYEGVPEGVMNPSIVGGIENYRIEALEEGDSVRLNFAFENISDLAFTDTLIIRYTILNTNTGKQIVEELKLNPLEAGKHISFSQAFSTAGLGGENIVQAYVNPRYLTEEYYDNNIISTSFRVREDETNPVLEVLFDGIHILDGDLVSPSPYIHISLHDENKFLFKQDTSEISLFLKAPCESGDCEYQQIFFSDPSIVQWTPATANKSFTIDYNPQNLSDGLYTLRVQGVDASGNLSAVSAYEMNFRVINESTVTNFLPYPNPFSTQTRFVFTLTGAEIPDEIKIQIMTVSGKVVREITQDELGTIRIGNNISDYAWDGRDEFGDVLANGVYLYRVILKSGGEEIKHRETSVDQAFKDGFGKIYILR